ncbi:peptide maturation system acyl carrier-related protein [Clostridium botulinum]|uniref:Peptide maturation system acyl carrier-related protein n=1 Tax=Clostridium botulinum TaxID=1491 RepID=A0A6B4JVA0_CLOBO|nr:peptide maturation system acyl carrier-related protein [Clostridium botulinum]KRU24782.1 peptide maturation system acyl carrier-related protein [Clostridium sporogenes]KRU28510.1 peptide maturation system acyl carrier-related protein [Clostridium sporogenes]KRU29832.1 peptide maturation system acyl carrier-related protein [Clostridium sporogenes]KRU37739.1 peptide maturation system acyl carrier-related protein [Clostridium sporogenes]MBZ1330620.1 peptide maturation system acyl carrier-relat
MINNNSVQRKLNDIFNRIFDINLNSINEELFERSLLGDFFCFEPIDLVCLYMEVEKIFNISIPQEYVVENRFNTINGIKEIIIIQLGQEEAIIS